MQNMQNMQNVQNMQNMQNVQNKQKVQNVQIISNMQNMVLMQNISFSAFFLKIFFSFSLSVLHIIYQNIMKSKVQCLYSISRTCLAQEFGLVILGVCKKHNKDLEIRPKNG